MKLVVFCLVAVCCCTVANTLTNGDETVKRKLLEVLRQVNTVKESLQHNEQMLNTPPQNIEDCCCLSALQCFQDNLQVHFNATESKQTNKLYKSLKNSITKRGLNFCHSENDQPTCQDCYLHPKENAREFFNRLKSLIQRAITRLSMK